MAILLIGSTGNGKSTLGNFLLNPEKDHIFKEQQTFRTARTNQPETQLVKSAAFNVGSVQSLSVIDTPGIYEDEDTDIEHMVNIIRALHTVGSIRAIILVVKFSSKIDTPYKASVKYYSKLLLGLFETNLITVMTDCACDERSKKLRALQEIDEEQMKRNIITEIADSCGVRVPPKLFTIDCLPMSEQEFVVNLNSRNDIILHIFALQTTLTQDLKLAKTDKIMYADRITAASLEGGVTAQGERLEKLSADFSLVDVQIKQLSKKVEAVSSVLSCKQEKVVTLDTQELVDGETWFVRTRWRLFKPQSQSFEVASKWPIRDVKYRTNGQCSWKYTSPCCIQGAVRSRCSRGLHARVTVEVYKCDKFAEDIGSLRDTISSKEELLVKVKKQHDESKERLWQITTEIETLNKNIEAKKQEIVKLSSEYLTMEECIQRFHV